MNMIKTSTEEDSAYRWADYIGRCDSVAGSQIKTETAIQELQELGATGNQTPEARVEGVLKTELPSAITEYRWLLKERVIQCTTVTRRRQPWAQKSALRSTPL